MLGVISAAGNQAAKDRKRFGLPRAQSRLDPRDIEGLMDGYERSENVFGAWQRDARLATVLDRYQETTPGEKWAH